MRNSVHVAICREMRSCLDLLLILLNLINDSEQAFVEVLLNIACRVHGVVDQILMMIAFVLGQCHHAHHGLLHIRHVVLVQLVLVGHHVLRRSCVCRVGRGLFSLVQEVS